MKAHLPGGASEEKLTETEEKTLEDRIAKATSPGEVETIVADQTTLSARRTAGRAAFLQSLDAPAQEQIEHLLVNKLTAEDGLIDLNPRAIKRLVNAYSFRSGFALSAGQTHLIAKLPYWCVLDLRFPYSAERLAAFPELAAGDAWMTDGMTLKDDGTWTGLNRHFPAQDHSDIRKILANLSAEDIRELRLYG